MDFWGINVKKEKMSAILCFAASLLFYAAAVVSRFASSDTSMTVVCICLGSAFLCLGAASKNKHDKD